MTEPELAGLIDDALAVARRHAAGEPDGEAVAAAGLTRSGAVHVGVWVAARVDSACLCAESGPLAQAALHRDPIVAIACVWVRGERAEVLPACGVCQERLAIYGPDVMIASGVPGAPVFRSLRELRPHPWWDVVLDGDG